MCLLYNVYYNNDKISYYLESYTESEYEFHFITSYSSSTSTYVFLLNHTLPEVRQFAFSAQYEDSEKYKISVQLQSISFQVTHGTKYLMHGILE